MRARVDAGRRLRVLRGLLRLVTIPQVRRHRGQLALLLVCVALGVSTIVAAGNLIRSSLASMERGWQIASDLADLRVANGFAGVPEELLETVRTVPGVAAAGAISTLESQAVRGEIVVPFSLVAVDLLGDDPVHRSVVGVDEMEIPDETVFVSRIDAVVLSRDLAQQLGVRIGDRFTARLASGSHELEVAGLLSPGVASALFDGALAVMDLPAAQVLRGREGLVEAIDVQVAPGSDLPAVRRALEAAVSGRATVSRAGGESEEFRSLIANLRLILGVPSVMGIVVGALVIYHAAAVSVSRRKPELDVLRSLGATRGGILAVFSVEGLLVGLVGALLGIALGILFSHLAAGIARGTVSSIYRPVATSRIEISLPHLALGAALGVGLTWLAFLGPARSALRVTGSLAHTSASRERWQAARRRAWVGAALIPLGVGIDMLQTHGFAGEMLAFVAMTGYALVLLGTGLLVPVLVLALLPPAAAFLRSRRLLLARLGLRGLGADPARSATVVTAVLVGAAYVLITVGPIGSLRQNIVGWVEQSQTADLVVAAPGSIGFFPTATPIPAAVGGLLAELPFVARVEPVQLLTQPYRERWAVVVGRHPEVIGGAQPIEVEAGDLERGREGMRRGTGTIVSGHFARQHAHRLGDVISLRSPTGPVALEIVTIVNDLHSADLGTVFVTPELLARRWGADEMASFQVWLEPGSDLVQRRDAIANALAPLCACSVLTRAEYVSRAANVIDAMFYMAYALEVVAALVMVVAVASFFLIAVAERSREIALLGTIGASGPQVFGSFLWEAVFIGLLGGSLGCLVGLPLSMRMTWATMRAGGGFDLAFVLPPWIAPATIAAAALLCAASALGPLWPLLRGAPAAAPLLAEE